MILLVFVCFSRSAFAAVPTGAVKLEDSDLAQVSYSGKRYLCGRISAKWIPGRSVSGYFYSVKVEIAGLTKTLKKTKSASARAKLQTKIRTLKTSLARGAAACNTVNAVVTPTPTPTASGNFDIVGNLTEAGKVAFGVPSNLSASANRGIGVWSNKCYGCHHSSPGVLGPNTFPAIKARIQLSPMSFNIPGEVTEQEIADVVAYRNY